MLLSAFGVATASLKVAVIQRTNPDVAPSRRNRQALEPAKLFRIADPGPIRRKINKALTVLAPLVTRRRVADITQPRRLRRLERPGCPGRRRQLGYPFRRAQHERKLLESFLSILLA